MIKKLLKIKILIQKYQVFIFLILNPIQTLIQKIRNF